MDYAGPVILKTTKLRGCKQYKAYICIFICMSTKAVNLELITGLATQAFIAALRRFVSRRGRPSNLYSDNDTNSVGANRDLKELRSFLKAEARAIAEEALVDQNVWHFMPPHAPNFGGLWEAGVKSIKYHIKRTINKTILRYEDSCKSLIQIETIQSTSDSIHHATLLAQVDEGEPTTTAANMSQTSYGQHSHRLFGHHLRRQPTNNELEIRQSRTTPSWKGRRNPGSNSEDCQWQHAAPSAKSMSFTDRARCRLMKSF